MFYNVQMHILSVLILDKLNPAFNLCSRKWIQPEYVNVCDYMAIVPIRTLNMKSLKFLSSFVAVFALLILSGCASTDTQSGTGEYVDDTVITTKVKAAIFNEPSLKSAEINVETFKGVVQLSGFVSSQDNINRAVSVARNVGGVVSVENDMELK